MKVLIIVPAYNEQDNIQRVINNLIENYSQYDYLVVNDGSRDATAEICRNKGYNLLDLPVNLGLSEAVQAGMRYAIKNNYDAAIQFDGDGQHNPEYIEKLIYIMEQEKADIVMGSRYLTQKKERTLRMLGSDILSFIIKISTGVSITDPTSGMRLFNRKMLIEFAYDMNYGPEPDTVSYLIKKGVRVKEVQVSMNERIAGESYLNLRRSIKYMMLMSFSILFIQRFRRGGM